MADKNSENFWQNDTGGSGESEEKKNEKNEEINEKEESSSVVPPPPQEVRIRTMKSDLESMAKSGGSASPSFQSVVMVKSKPVRRYGPFLWVVAIVVISAITLISASYLLYDSLSGNGETSAVNENNSGDGAARPGAPQEGTTLAQESPEFTHSSLFQKPPEMILSFVVRGAAEKAEELKTFSQSLTEFLAASAGGEDFIEIRMQNGAGGDLAASEVLKAQDALILTEDFILSKFNPDPTFFASKKEGNYFIGYVLSLKPGENWLFLKDEVAKLEWSNKISSFFLRTPGAKSGQGFEDIVIEGQPARKLSFVSGESFVYGWLRGNLILSASEEGFREAIARL